MFPRNNYLDYSNFALYLVSTILIMTGQILLRSENVMKRQGGLVCFSIGLWILALVPILASYALWRDDTRVLLIACYLWNSGMIMWLFSTLQMRYNNIKENKVPASFMFWFNMVCIPLYVVTFTELAFVCLDFEKKNHWVCRTSFVSICGSVLFILNIYLRDVLYNQTLPIKINKPK